MFEMPKFEMFCDDGTYEGSALQRYYSLVEEASGKAGRSLSFPEEGEGFERVIREAGFEGLEVTKRVLPLGSWPKERKEKELGKWAKVSLETGFEAYGMALLTRVMVSSFCQKGGKRSGWGMRNQGG